MRFPRFWCSPVLAVALALAPAALPAAEPAQIAPAFEVSAASGSGGPTVDVTFALALSEVSSYPVTITAIAGDVEEVLYNGSLQGGLYRISAPLTKIKSGALKVILKTKVTNRAEGGSQSFLSYQRWEGTIPR